MKKDAEMHADEDKKKKDVIDAKNIAEQMVYTAEKALKDAGDKVGEDIKTGVNGKIEALKTANKGDNLEEIKKASEELSTEMQKIGSVMSAGSASGGAQATPEAGAQADATAGAQAQAGEQAQAGDQTQTKEGEGNVRDAEFEEKKDEDK